MATGNIGKILPAPYADDREQDHVLRLKRYGEVNVSEAGPNDFGYAEEGSYFHATNVAVGTGATWVTAQTSFSDVAPNWYIENIEDATNPNAKSIWVKFIKMITTAVATSATLIRYAAILDSPRAFGTDNTLLITPTCPNGACSPNVSPIIKVQNNATASALAASSAKKRIVANGMLGGLNVVGTTLQVNFGQLDAGGPGNGAVAETVPVRRVECDLPIVIPPGKSLAIHVWLVASAAAPNPEWTIGMVAR